MSSNVRSIIVQTMRENGMNAYTSQAEPVIQAVEQAALNASQTILNAADGVVSRGEVERILGQAGLPVPQPEPVATQASSDEQAPAWAEALVRRISSLEEMARRNGVR